MKYFLRLFFALTAIGVFFTSVHFSVNASAGSDTVAYLSAQTQNAWTTMALEANGVNQNNPAHLKTVSGTSATDYARTILGITSTGNNPKTYASEDLVSALKNFYQQNQIGDVTLQNDDVWGILALMSAGESQTSEIIAKSKDFLLKNQNDDGGWSYAVGNSSDTNDTAITIVALLESGVSKDTSVVQKGIAYLKLSQNADGGFPFTAGGLSDSASTAWVGTLINRLGEDISSWKKETKSGADFLSSMKKNDGSYRWMESSEAGNPLVTAYVAVALSGKWYPVRTISVSGGDSSGQNNDQNNNTGGDFEVGFRIEGSGTHICSGKSVSSNPLQMIKDHAASCGYSYTITDTAWGPYLEAIGPDKSQGQSGWMYLVNWVSPIVGANDYVLKSGDEVLWFFGEFSEDGNKPTRLQLSKTQANANENISANVEYFEAGFWKPVAKGSIQSGGKSFPVQNGTAFVSFDQNGVYQAVFEGEGYIRSAQVSLNIGVSASQEVSLKTNIIQPNTTPMPQIAFRVNESSVDFSSLAPGQSSIKKLTVQNIGNVSLNLSVDVSGDTLFTDGGNFSLNNTPWKNFSSALSVQQSKELESKLSVPSSYAGSGVKTGKIIFWASAGN